MDELRKEGVQCVAMGIEKGTEGTTHIQGYVEFQIAQKRFSRIVRLLSVEGAKPPHVEKARSNRDDNLRYCSKDGECDVFGCELPGPTLAEQREAALKSYFDSIVWRDWQQKLIDICTGPRDERTIHWVYDEQGGSGKSLLSQFLAWKHHAIICGGKKSDMYHQVAVHCESHAFVDIVLWDITREAAARIQYEVLEELKNGCLSSGKYEGYRHIQARSHAPHVLVFANSLPDMSKLSADRWKVYTIEDGVMSDYEPVDLNIPANAGDFYVPNEYN
jgi:hypothetical protein